MRYLLLSIAFVALATALLWLYIRPDQPDFFLGADTGAKTAGSIPATGSWSNFTTTRLGTSDNSRASLGNSFNGSWAEAATFTFNIPAGATIDGIAVTLEQRDTDASDTAIGTVALSWDNGTSWTTSKTDATPAGSADETVVLGGAADTWGRAWTDTEFADGTFRVRVTATSIPTAAGASYQVDFLSVTVYYTGGSVTESGGKPTFFIKNGGAFISGNAYQK